MISACIGYVVFLVLVIWIERIRVRRIGRYDFLMLFMVMFAIQIVIPPLITTAVFSFAGRDVQTGVWFYQRIIHDVTPVVVWAVLMLSVCFWATVYAVWFSLSRRFIGRELEGCYVRDQRIRRGRWMVAMAIGVIAMIYLLHTTGGVNLYGYVNLINLRSGREGVKTLASQDLLAFSQSFALLAILGVVWSLRRKSVLGFIVAAGLSVFFAIMSVSRREILIEIMVLYFTGVLWFSRFRLKHILFTAVLALPVLVFGKAFLYGVSQSANDSITAILANRAGGLDIASALVSASLDLGRSVTESWATLMYLHLPPRFGIDAVLSILRHIFLSGTLGLDLQWPERIVRISTRVFISSFAEDEPPGFIGQMWLDFRIFGPVMWGILMAFQIALLQRIYNRSRKTPEVTALYVVLFYIIALVINTGSFDFSFSIDWVLLVILSFWICKTSPLVRRNLHKPEGVMDGAR